MTPMAASSAMMAAIVSAGVSPGMATMSSPTEHTQVMASKLFQIQRAALHGMNHADILTDGNEGTTQAANMVTGHDAALLDGIIEAWPALVVPGAP